MSEKSQANEEKAGNVAPTVDPPVSKSWLPRAKVTLDYMKGNHVGFIEDRWKKVNHAPVFKTSVGVPCIVLVDHVSVKHFLAQGADVFDRQDDLRFGPSGARDGVFGDHPPVLLCTDELDHSLVRKFTIEVFKKRVHSFQSSFDSAAKHVLPDVLQQLTKDPKSMTLQQAVGQLSSEVLYQFLWEEHAPKTPNFMYEFATICLDDLKTRSCMPNILLKILISISRIGKRSTEETLGEALSIVRESRHLEAYKQIATDLGFKSKDIDKNLLYATQLNGCLAPAFILGGVMANLTQDRDLWRDLRSELDNMDVVNMQSVSDTKSYPLLEALAWEVARFYFLATVTFRAAVQDTEIPAGDGKLYRVKKGKLVLGMAPLALRDTGVFGEDAAVFNPRRFIENPHLKEEVFAFGFVSEESVPTARYGCPMHVVNLAHALNKMMAATMVKGFEWELEETPVFEYPYTGGYGPEEVHFRYFRERERHEGDEQKDE